MKQRVKRGALQRLSTMLLMMLLTVAAWAENVTVNYIDADGQTQSVSATVLTGTESEIGSSGQTTWYVVNSNVTSTTKERLDCYGTVNIILKDGCTLTVPKGIRVSTSCTLNIYAQSEAEATMGGIHAEGGGEDWAAIGGHKNY